MEVFVHSDGRFLFSYKTLVPPCEGAVIERDHVLYKIWRVVYKVKNDTCGEVVAYADPLGEGQRR